MEEKVKEESEFSLSFDIEFKIFVSLLLFVLLVSLVITIIRSIYWPIPQDSGVMLFISNQILNGKIPYQEVFDINFPGTHLMHMFVIQFIGKSDLAWRIFDLGNLFLIVGGILLFLWKYSKFAAIISALLFSSTHLMYGPINAGQRDYFLLVFLIYAFYVVLVDDKKHASDVATGINHENKLFSSSSILRIFRQPLFFTGVLLGSAAMIKPYVVLLGLLLAVRILFASRKKQDKIRNFLGFAIGSTISPLLVFGWLGKTGGLAGFIDLIFNYLLPFYSSQANPSIQVVFSNLLNLPAVIFLMGILIMLLLVTKKIESSVELQLILIGVLYGFLHYYIQGKGWLYHQYPFTLFSLMLVGVSLYLLLKKGTRYTIVGLLMTLLYTMIFIGSNSLIIFTSYWDNKEQKSIAPLTADILSFNLDKTDTIQIMDSTHGGTATLLILDIDQPTRFVYDTVFYHDTDTAYIQGLQQEFLDDMKQNMPELIVIYKESGAEFLTLDRLNAFGEFQIFLAENYTLAVDRDLGKPEDSYLLYHKK